MLHFLPKYFFCIATKSEEIAYKSLQPLGFLPTPSVHKMLQKCNILGCTQSFRGLTPSRQSPMLQLTGCRQLNLLFYGTFLKSPML